MKKIIAILVVFAMVAAVAFAETTVFGSVETRWAIAQDTGSGVTTQGWQHAATAGLSAVNDEGTLGGMFKLTFADDGHPNDGSSGDVMAWVRPDRFFVWWQPIPQVRFFLGEDGDGLMNSANIIRWAHHRMPRGIAVEGWDGSDYLLGNYDNFGAVISIMPIDWVTLHVALGLGARESNGSNGAMDFSDLFQDHLQIQAVIAPEGIGTFYLTYRQNSVSSWPVSTDRIGLTYLSGSFIEGLQFEVGGNYALTGNDDPIRFAIGATYSLDAFGVRFRAVMHPRSSFFFFQADVMPYYAFDFGTLFFNIRLCQENSNNIGWHINPYLRMNIGGGDLRVGFLLEDHDGNGSFTWKLPISMLVSF